MTYELAKKLKDAGFPIADHFEDDQSWDCFKCGQSAIGDAYHCVPTLSELIEACPKWITRGYHSATDKEKEYHFEISPIPDDENEWCAGYFFYDESAQDPFPQDGKTPEEAVAKLWLELNQHSEKHISIEDIQM